MQENQESHVIRTIGMRVSTLWEDYLDTNLLFTEVTTDAHEKCVDLLNAASEVWSQAGGSDGDAVLVAAAEQCTAWISEVESVRVAEHPGRKS